MMDLMQFKTKFIEDAHDLLNKLDNDLISFEKNPDDTGCIERIFRVMHTLKGTSGMYGFDYIGDITHDLESIFDLVRDNLLKVTTELFDLTLASGDHIRNLLADESLSDEQNKILHQKIKAQIQHILLNAGQQLPSIKLEKPKNQNENKIRTWHILFSPSEDIIKRAINILYTLSDLLNLGYYRIQEPDHGEQSPFWSIFLVTDKSLTDIEEELIFVMDYCRINLIAEFDIFKEEELEKRKKALEEKAKTPLVELNNQIENIGSLFPTNEQKQIKLERQNTGRINVDSAKLDHLMFLVSELVTTKSELLLSIQLKNNERILESALKVDKLSKLFRDNALSIRLISLQEITLRFNRLVRDLSNLLGKKVDFDTHGEDIELDKNIIDNISEPIMHLIRNCIDHGIETPEERVKSNKPETGIVKLFAYKSGNFVFIQISDDGKGIDKQKIIEKAVSMGILKESTQITDNEIYDLIFLPGFSTAESLTHISGRGVGMDIVRKRIQDVRGEIHIDSEIGLGTSFTIKLQQTISIIDTLLVRSDESKFAIPLEEIENCQLISADVQPFKQNRQISYVGELIPYISLREEFKYTSPLPEKQKIIVINKQEKRFAIIVDEIIGEYQAAVKSIGKTFSEVEFISGASLLGDGSIALLLDTEKLKKQLINNH